MDRLDKRPVVVHLDKLPVVEVLGKRQVVQHTAERTVDVDRKLAVQHLAVNFGIQYFAAVEFAFVPF